MHSDHEQVFATHTAYAAMLQKLIYGLAAAGVITPERAKEVVEHGKEQLQHSNVEGDLVTIAIDGLESLAEAIGGMPVR